MDLTRGVPLEQFWLVFLCDHGHFCLLSEPYSFFWSKLSKDDLLLRPKDIICGIQKNNMLDISWEHEEMPTFVKKGTKWCHFAQIWKSLVLWNNLLYLGGLKRCRILCWFRFAEMASLWPLPGTLYFGCDQKAGNKFRNLQRQNNHKCITPWPAHFAAGKNHGTMIGNNFELKIHFRPLHAQIFFLALTSSPSGRIRWSRPNGNWSSRSEWVSDSNEGGVVERVLREARFRQIRLAAVRVTRSKEGVGRRRAGGRRALNRSMRWKIRKHVKAKKGNAISFN